MQNKRLHILVLTTALTAAIGASSALAQPFAAPPGVEAVDMETGMRGFMLSGKEEFLEPYDGGKERFFVLIDELANTVSDNPPQVQLLKEPRIPSCQQSHAWSCEEFFLIESSVAFLQKRPF